MNCTVYWGNEGFVLVPDCMIASREAERRFGPLLRCGSFDTDGIEPGLARTIDQEVDQHSFVMLSTGLALRLGYEPGSSLPLPQGFSWAHSDWWERGGELALLCGRDPSVAVATIEPSSPHGGWKAITNCHKNWAFRGTWISSSRAAVVQFVTIWANTNADTVRRDVGVSLH